MKDRSLRALSKRLLIYADDVVHVVVALLLIGATGVILVNTIGKFSVGSTAAMVEVINDGLLALIIMEILWTIVRYLGKQEFSLNPFLFIGIIAGIRRLLSIEAELSLGHTPDVLTSTIELGVVALIILILVFAYYLANKAGEAPPHARKQLEEK